MVYSGVERRGRCNRNFIKPEVAYEGTSLGVRGDVRHCRRALSASLPWEPGQARNGAASPWTYNARWVSGLRRPTGYLMWV